MNKLIFSLLVTLVVSVGYSQTAGDLFRKTEHKISWLGIDFSQVKLIGEFNHFFGAGSHSVVDVRDEYFNRWNKLVLAEPNKYDLRSMLRKTSIFYDIDMINAINSSCSVEDMEELNTPNYSLEQIRQFISLYPIENKSGIGVLMIAESLNKYAQEAYFHVVILNMETKEILIHERIRSKPSGFGLRNYWAGAIHQTMKQVENTYYRKWKYAHQEQ